MRMRREEGEKGKTEHEDGERIKAGRERGRKVGRQKNNMIPNRGQVDDDDRER
jgi:hypothetical protein